MTLSLQGRSHRFKSWLTPAPDFVIDPITIKQVPSGFRSGYLYLSQRHNQ